MSKETFNLSSSELKVNFLKNHDFDNVILVDDDNGVLFQVHKSCPNIVLFQDSELVD